MLVENYRFMRKVRKEMRFDRYRLALNNHFLNELVKNEDEQAVRDKIKALREQIQKLQSELNASKGGDKRKEKEIMDLALKMEGYEKQVNAIVKRKESIETNRQLLEQNQIFQDIIKTKWRII